MKIGKSISLMILVTLTAMPVLADDHGPDATARMQNGAGDTVGEVQLREGPAGLVLEVAMEGLPEGWKAIHIHRTGTCADNEAGFTASGGHVDPSDEEHGLLNPAGPELGDLPNIWVHEDGTVRAEIFAGGVDLSGEKANLLDEDGSALVVHEGRDDHMTQPIGGAGSRIACGVISGN